MGHTSLLPASVIKAGNGTVQEGGAVIKADFTINLLLFGGTGLCQIFKEQRTLAGNILKDRRTGGNISDQNTIIGNKGVVGNAHLEEVGFQFGDVHAADIAGSGGVVAQLLFIQGGDSLLLIRTTEQNHVAEHGTGISHSLEQLLQKVNGNGRITSGNGGAGGTQFKHTTGLVGLIGSGGLVEGAVQEGEFHITGNLLQALGNLPIQFRSGVGRLTSGVQAGQLATVRHLCIGDGDSLVEDLGHIGFLLTNQRSCGGGSFRRIFSDSRLVRFREFIELTGGELVIFSFHATGQAADHGQEGGLHGGSGEQITGKIGKIESVTSSSDIDRHNQTSFLVSKFFRLEKLNAFSGGFSLDCHSQGGISSFPGISQTGFITAGFGIGRGGYASSGGSAGNSGGGVGIRLEKKAGAFTLHQLADFIRQAGNGAIIRNRGLLQKRSQKGANRGRVDCLGILQGGIHSVINLQLLQFGIMLLLLIGVGRLQFGDLIFQGFHITGGLLKGFKLGIPLLDGGLCGLKFRVDLIKPGLGNKRTVQGFHHLCCLIFSQAHSHQTFFGHSKYLHYKILFYRGSGTTISPGSLYRPNRERGEWV
nr:MAG TPA: hypothetical protein [Bacteriophage sp.]